MAVVGAVLAQFPWHWIGIAIVVIAGFTAPIVAGGAWNRAGAATLAAVTTFALGLFAGPTLYETYVKLYGEKADALVADTAKYENARRNNERNVCRVVDTSGKVQDLSEQQNCHGQFKPGQHIILYKDPLGVLEPWAEATDDRSFKPVNLSATGGLFAATAATLFYAGMRRRSDQEMDAKKLRKYGPPRRSEP
ncbi:hypothetical protein [Streptomyces malaysiense]|uniref:Uncharacterized protein n=1 Tax=Streptomyces malaysiense TaxID=1428626 RepID=A0A1J4Q7J2_9ACTN|nr:hypothetical protein [Streptomyces malaysiense]OIK28468.1 hypothetical protein VT52_007460 [Streptomyces malaysiense]